VDGYNFPGSFCHQHKAYFFRYNPVSKILRVYKRLVIEIKAVGDDGENPLTEEGKRGRGEEGKRRRGEEGKRRRGEEGKRRRGEEETIVRAFEGIYERNFLNYNEYRGGTRYTPLEEDGNMLIISYGSFMTDMQDFVRWKNMEGIPTVMVNVSSIGTTAAQIKTYVANYYNTNGLTYLLLVGDAAQVPPSSTTAGTSDNDYGYIVGSDHYPDIFVGRFSAEANAHVQTQVLRTLNYEKEPGLSPEYFQRAMCIGSDQGPGDDSEYDYKHQLNLRTDYMNFTYTYGAKLYNGSQGGQDAGAGRNGGHPGGKLHGQHQKDVRRDLHERLHEHERNDKPAGRRWLKNLLHRKFLRIQPDNPIWQRLCFGRYNHGYRQPGIIRGLELFLGRVHYFFRCESRRRAGCRMPAGDLFREPGGSDPECH
jgi:hypothetical protein